MEIKYSKEPFEGYAYRFIVEFEVKNPGSYNFTNITIYSNSGSYIDLDNFLKEKKSDRVLSFKIVHKASKEQDEATTKFLEENLKDW